MDHSQSQKYNVGRGCVYNLNYHLVWTPKRRASVLVGNIATTVREIFEKSSKEIGVSILTMEVMPDHVHLFVSSSPKVSPHVIVKRLKGASSNLLRKEFPQLLKLPCMWSPSYYCGSVGFASESTVRTYIENQKGK